MEIGEASTSNPLRDENVQHYQMNRYQMNGNRASRNATTNGGINLKTIQTTF